MNQPVRLTDLLASLERKPAEQLVLFALISLGIIQSLGSGLLSASDAVRVYFNAENCLYVRKRLKDKLADRIMSHGVQLADLFDMLSPNEAYREFQRELEAMRAMVAELIEKRKLAA